MTPEQAQALRAAFDRQITRAFEDPNTPPAHYHNERFGESVRARCYNSPVPNPYRGTGQRQATRRPERRLK